MSTNRRHRRTFLTSHYATRPSTTILKATVAREPSRPQLQHHRKISKYNHEIQKHVFPSASTTTLSQTFTTNTMSTTTEDTTPSALSSAPPPGLTELNNLIDSLNNLITSYLNLFDIYQPLRENLSKKLSSGFFNISQANYASPGHKRYGEDYFDDRMKALRGVHIIHPATPTSPSSITPNNPAAQQSTEDLKLLHHPTFKLHDFLLPSNSNPAHEIKEEEEEGGLRRRKVHNTTTTTTTNDITTTNEKEEVYTNGYNNNNEKEKEDELIPPLSAAKRLDPLRWFGVLIPQSLRTAQRDFIDSLEDITTLSTLLSEMDRHEECIRELREQIKVKKKELEGRVVEYQWKTVAGGVGGG